MLLSIVVPVYNTEAYLVRCLGSLLDQDLDPSDYEIIVVNDGSRDRSLAIANGLAKTNPNIVVVSQGNQGVSAARNAGIGLARGEYLYFVDSDDYVALGVLGGLVGLMRRERLDVLAFSHLDLRPDEEVPRTRVQYDPWDRVEVTTGLAYLAVAPYRPNTVWWYLTSRALLTELGIRFEVGRLVADAVFTANVVCAASRFAFVPVDIYRYSRRPGSIIRDRSTATTTRLIADYEHVVVGLDDLRQRLAARQAAPSAALERLANRQRTFVFFLIGRLVRSDVLIRPTLPAILARLRVIQMYPIARLTDRDQGGLRFELLRFVYNREYLLYPAIALYRAVGRLRLMRSWERKT